MVLAFRSQFFRTIPLHEMLFSEHKQSVITYQAHRYHCSKKTRLFVHVNAQTLHFLNLIPIFKIIFTCKRTNFTFLYFDSNFYFYFYNVKHVPIHFENVNLKSFETL